MAVERHIGRTGCGLAFWQREGEFTDDHTGHRKACRAWNHGYAAHRAGPLDHWGFV
jgi:hypothetical protein